MGLKKPPAYVHPRKRGQTDKPIVEETTEAVVEIKEANKKKKEVVSAEKQLKPSIKSTNRGDTVLIRLVSRIPQTGEINLFDQMIEGGLSPKDAILGILKRNFDKLDLIITDRKSKTLGNVRFSSRKAIETTRKVRPDFQQKILDTFDPFGILTDRALGQKIGEALISYSEKEK